MDHGESPLLTVKFIRVLHEVQHALDHSDHAASQSDLLVLCGYVELVCGLICDLAVVEFGSLRGACGRQGKHHIPGRQNDSQQIVSLELCNRRCQEYLHK